MQNVFLPYSKLWDNYGPVDDMRSSYNKKHTPQSPHSYNTRYQGPIKSVILYVVNMHYQSLVTINRNLMNKFIMLKNEQLKKLS